MNRTEKALMLVSAIGWLLAVLATVVSVKKHIQDERVVHFPPQEVIERVSPSCPSGMTLEVNDGRLRVEASSGAGALHETTGAARHNHGGARHEREDRRMGAKPGG